MDTVINSEAILADVRLSRCLGKSARQFKLLKFLLEKSIAGEADTVTQYGIALDVLDRGEDFDPANDSIVRVEMHRLRSALKRYNGTSDKYRLILPKGGFNIEVETVAQKNGFSAPWFGRFGPVAAAGLAVVSFGVGTLTNFWADPLQNVEQVCATYIPNVEARAVGEQSSADDYLKPLLTSMLTQYSSISVVDDVRACRNAGTPGYVATLSSLQFDDNLSVLLEVRDERSGKAITSRVFDSEEQGLQGKEVNAAFNIWLAAAVSDLSNPYGIIVREALKQEWSDSKAQEGYNCIISMYDEFYTVESDEAYYKSLNCLEQVSQYENASLDVKGSLAINYLEQVKKYREPTVEDPVKIVEDLINESGDRWIDSYHMVNAKLSFEADRPNFNEDQFRSILSQVEAKFTWNGHVKLLLSIYYGFTLGEWERAAELIQEAHAIHSVRDNSMMVVITAYEMLKPGGVEDVTVCLDSYSDNMVLMNFISLGCVIQAGDDRWINKINENLAKLGYDTQEKKLHFMRDIQLDEKLSSVIIRAIENNTTKE